MNRSRVNEQVFESVFESLALHTVNLSAKVDTVGAGFLIFHDSKLLFDKLFQSEQKSL